MGWAIEENGQPVKRRGLKPISSVLQLCGISPEMAYPDTIGKVVLYNVQNAAVPIIVAHVFFGTKIFTSLNCNFFFFFMFLLCDERINSTHFFKTGFTYVCSKLYQGCQ